MRESFMKYLFIILSVIVLGLAPITSFAKKSKVPEVTIEGLELIPNVENLAYVWAEPGADLSQYNRVMLAQPYVAFKKNWKRKQNDIGARVTNADMNRIKVSASELFMLVFTEELEKSGYVLTNERAEDVLLVKPAIIDLDVNAPNVLDAGTNRTYTSKAGSLTLYMELYDSETDDLIAKAMDAKSDRTSAGVMSWKSGPANQQIGMDLMRPWAVALVKGLDRSRSSTKQ
jgi:hypothetical protein